MRVCACVCVSAVMEFKTDVRTFSALLDQFFERRRVLILSAPNIADHDYKLQNLMIQVGERDTWLVRAMSVILSE